MTINIDKDWAEKAWVDWQTPLGKGVTEALGGMPQWHGLAYGTRAVDVASRRSAAIEVLKASDGPWPQAISEGSFIIRYIQGTVRQDGDGMVRFPTYDLALIACVAEALGVKVEQEKPATPDRTEEWHCVGVPVHTVYEVVGPPENGEHPCKVLWMYSGSMMSIPSTRQWGEHTLTVDPRVPPMPACPPDKRLTGINLCPKKGDWIVTDLDEAFGVKVGENPGSPMPWGPRRWSWEPVEAATPAYPDRRGQWLMVAGTATRYTEIIGLADDRGGHPLALGRPVGGVAYEDNIVSGNWLPIPPRPPFPADSAWELTGECREFVPGKDDGWVSRDCSNLIARDNPGAYHPHPEWAERVWIACRKAAPSVPHETNRQRLDRLEREIAELKRRMEGAKANA